ncbi:hypothetical protein ABIG06_002831 [Bradyrhizobium sp. USDA 326]|uniref:hypothetical protein n=1 Tax=unclassified Bradyrhizobium TaxID=2631580 RepID=UPI00351130B6
MTRDLALDIVLVAALDLDQAGRTGPGHSRSDFGPDDRLDNNRGNHRGNHQGTARA